MGNCCQVAKFNEFQQQEKHKEFTGFQELDFVNVEKQEEKQKKIEDQKSSNVKIINFLDLSIETEPEIINIHGPIEYQAKLQNLSKNLKDQYQLLINKLGKFSIDKEILTNEQEQQLCMLQPYIFQDGSIYFGEWKNKQFNGIGLIFQQNDTTVYEGQFLNGKKIGKGRCIFNSGDVYEGNWQNDLMYGNGIYFYEDGTYYNGQWENNLKHGNGEEIFSNKSKYSGEYFQGKKQGKGQITWEDGSMYQGQFQEDKISGFGVYKWADGRVYNGELQGNKMHGKGECVLVDGGQYSGQYFEDKMHGYGVYKWKDGRVYDGQWYQGKQHGKGIMIMTDGTKKQGQWVDGRRVKWLEQQDDESSIDIDKSKFSSE